jgi:hypothetical protein
VTPHGFWLLIGERELFVAFRDFPWFKDASIGEITKVGLPGPHHLCWPELDVDLAVESIEHPQKYPLVSEAPPVRRVRKKRRGEPRRTGTRSRLRG